jgi:hypothetical protein
MSSIRFGRLDLACYFYPFLDNLNLEELAIHRGSLDKGLS